MTQEDTPAVLSVHQARKQFAETVALDGVELSLSQGEWLGLLGPNGAGKTTLIRAIAGRVRLDEGRVEVLGTSLAGADGEKMRGRLGIVPQDIALYPWLTAAENLRAFGRLHGVPASELSDRSAWAIEWTGLSERTTEPVNNFSGGMKRRLNIACAVLHRPEVLLLDEPTAGVDPQSRERIWEMLADQQRDGTSILLTTHQLDEAQQVCERIVIIDHGRVIAKGSMSQLVESTIGQRHQVTLSLDRPLESVDAMPGAWQTEADGLILKTQIGDPITGLPSIMQAVQQANRKVHDLQVASPSLHNVFLHLTGRELRE